MVYHVLVLSCILSSVRVMGLVCTGAYNMKMLQLFVVVSTWYMLAQICVYTWTSAYTLYKLYMYIPSTVNTTVTQQKWTCIQRIGCDATCTLYMCVCKYTPTVYMYMYMHSLCAPCKLTCTAQWQQFCSVRTTGTWQRAVEKSWVREDGWSR